MKVLSLLALLAATAPLKRVNGSSVRKVATNSSLAETSPFIEDPGEVSITMRSGSDEPADSGDERTIKWPKFAQKAVSKIAKLATIPLSFETNEMKAFREVQVNKNALETLKSSNTQKTLIAAPTKADEDDVVEIALVGSKKSGDVETKTTTTALLEQQLNGWLKNVISPGDFLTSLKLHEGHVGAKLEAFDQLLTAYNKKNPGHIDILDFLTLKLGGEGELASVLAKGAKSDATENAKALELEEMLITKWKNEKLSAQDIVDRLKLTETIDDLVSPKLSTFLKHIASISGDANDWAGEIMVLEMSTNRFGDEAVAVALVRARDDAFLKPHVEKLETRLLDIWLGDGKSPEDIFSMMNVDAARTDAYFDQQVVVLKHFIEIYNKKEKAHVTLLAVMTSGCGGEDSLASVLGTLRTNPLASAKVLELESLLHKKWKVENLTPENVIYRLKMYESVEDLTSQKLGTLLKYSATYNEENVGYEFSLPDTFTRHFGSNAVVEAIVKDESFYDSTAEIKMFEVQLLQGWLAHRYSEYFVASTLKLRMSKPPRYFDQRVEMFESFLKLYNEERSTQFELFPTMVSCYGGEHVLAQVLVWAMVYEGPSKQTLRLERLLLSKWKNEKLKPNAIVRRLRMTDDVKESAIPKLVMFMKYIAMCYRKRWKLMLTLPEVSTERLGDEIIMGALVLASKLDFSKEDMKVLVNQIGNSWLAAGKPIDRVHKSLGIGKLELIAFFDQQVEVLEDFMKLYNENKSTDVDLLTTMTSICGSEEKLAWILGCATGYEHRSKKALELAKLLLEKWRNEKLTPETVMHRLGMTRQVGEMTSPKLEIFVKFMDMHQKEDPTRELSVLNMFTTCFGHARVVETVAKARAGRLPDAYEKVLELQQLKIWLAEGKTADDVLKILRQGMWITPEILFDQRVPVLENYIELYNTDNFLHVDLLTVMTSGFGGEKGLCSVLSEAMKKDRKSEEAVKLLNRVLARWGAKNFSPGDVLVRLGAAETVDQLASEVPRIVRYYADIFDKAYPMRKFSLLETFITRFGVEAVLEELVRARTADPLNQHVKKLEKELLSSWYSVNKSLEEVFALLNMNSHVHKAPRGLKLKMLINYMASKHNWSCSSIYEALEKCYGDDIIFALTLVEAKEIPGLEDVVVDDYLFSLFDRWCHDSVKPDREFIKIVKERDAVNWATLVDKYTEYYDEEAVDVIHMTVPRRV